MKHFFKLFVLLCILNFLNSAFAFSRGIYITQSTAQNAQKLNYLIQESKKYSIDTFIIDVNAKPNAVFTRNVKNVIQNGIHFVARVVVFPNGGTHTQVLDKKIWAKKLMLAKAGAQLGATAVQLDYIRFRAENPPSPEKARKILTVVNYFKSELAPYHVSLQMDIFGVAALKPAHTIGQDVGILASAVDAFCPMVYPSHYEPFRVHAVQPYETIFRSVSALKKQLRNYPNVSIYAFIELYNYRFMMSHANKLKYIAAEMKATHDAGAHGWYVWSPNNHYAPLFEVLRSRTTTH